MAQLTNLDGAFRFLREPGAWLWMAALAGAAARAYLVIFTEGTLDVLVWEGHAREIGERGLMTYYHGGTYQFNHPPLMGLLASKAWSLSQSSAIPFEVLLRAPFALLDAGTAWLLVRLLEHRPQRYLVAAVYWRAGTPEMVSRMLDAILPSSTAKSGCMSRNAAIAGPNLNMGRARRYAMSRLLSPSP